MVSRPGENDQVVDGHSVRRRRPHWWIMLAGVALLLVPVIAASVPCREQGHWPIWLVGAALAAGSLAVGFGLAQSADGLVGRAVITVVVGGATAYVVGFAAFFHAFRCFEF
jgi:hypothetical protein